MVCSRRPSCDDGFAGRPKSPRVLFWTATGSGSQRRGGRHSLWRAQLRVLSWTGRLKQRRQADNHGKKAKSRTHDPGHMQATENEGLGGEEPLWPRGASSDILERTGWRDSFDGGGEGGAEDNPGGDPHGSLRDSIEEARFGADQNGTNALRNEYKATQQLVAAAGLEAVSPLSLVAIVAIAEALDATVNDLQTFAHTLHASGLTTNGGAPLTLPQPKAARPCAIWRALLLNAKWEVPKPRERHSGGVKVEGTKMTPRSPKMNDGGDIEGLLMYPSTPARGDGSSTVTPAFADSASAGASLGELAHRARRISDTAADLGAKVTALATLLPLRLSGSERLIPGRAQRWLPLGVGSGRRVKWGGW